MKSIKSYIKNVVYRLVADLRTYGIGICGFFVYEWMMSRMFQMVCPFVLLTGFPCAGCGLTRSVYWLLRGQVEKSIAYHPMGFAWVAWGVYFIVQRYLIGKPCKWVMRTLVVVCLLTLATYGYRMLTAFPGEPPMVYYQQNFLSEIFALYQKMQ